MLVARPAPRLTLLCLGVIACSIHAPSAPAESWEAIPRDLPKTVAGIDTSADAEAVFWRIRVEDVWDGNVLYSDQSQYLRIRIFNERGQTSQSQVSIPYDSRTKILDLQARVVRPDGSVLEIPRKSIFERTVLKAGGRKIQEKTFAAPDLKPGSLLEYRWTERNYDRLANYLRLDLQKEIPVRLLELKVKPLADPDVRFQFRIRSFHGPTPTFEEGADGFHVADLANVPAFRAEPKMPPENAVRHWILLQYAFGDEPPPTQAWKRFGKEASDGAMDLTRADGSVKKAAQEAVAGAGNDPEKLRRLVAYCRAHVHDVGEDAVGTPAAPGKMGQNKSPGETLRRGVGTSLDIHALLTALAGAAGLQARLALLPDPDQSFEPEMYTPYFLTQSCTAVWVEGRWIFVNAAERYTPDGALPSYQEGRPALILDGEGTFVRTPMTAPDVSTCRRRGVFQLAPDGTLEGDVQLTFGGHWGEAMKEDADDVSPEQQEKNLRDEIRSGLSTAEVTSVHFEHASDGDGPYARAYHVRVPGFATRTGKRLIFDPAFFQAGQTSPFHASGRQFPIEFDYSWSEDDSVAIHLPTGFHAEALPSLQPLTFPDLGGYDGQIAASLDGATLLFRRRFEFGRNGTLLFPPSQYTALKQAFDGIAERDNLSISLTVAAEGTGP